MPGKKRFRRVRLSDTHLQVSVLNSMMESIERLDSIISKSGVSGSIIAEKGAATESIRLVRMTENIGPDESSEFRERTGVVRFWNPVECKWKDTDPAIEVDVIATPYGHFPVPEDTIVATYFHKQSNKHIVLNPPQILHVRTVDPYTGSYPTAASKTYPIAFTITSYENELNAELDSELMDDDVNRLAPSPPHGGKSDGTTTDDKYGYVYNLGDGYIPIDTDIAAWFACGQLYTYYSSGNGVIGRTKTGGISAMTGSTWPYQLGSGTVDVALIQGETSKELVDSNTDLLVYNSTHWTIPADTVIQIKYVNGVPFVDVDDCPINGS